MKKIILFILILFILPLEVLGEDDYENCTSSLEGNIIVECEKNTLAPGETTSCSIKANITNGEIDGMNFIISTNDINNLVISEDITYDSFWTQDSRSYLIIVYNSEGTTKTGVFDVINFSVTATDKTTTGIDEKINVKDIHVRDGGTCSQQLENVSTDLRIASTIDTLQSLKLSVGTLSPVFNENTTDYTAEINAEKVHIEALTKSQYATTSGTGEITLNPGINNIVIKVTSEAGTSKNYNITINRPTTDKTTGAGTLTNPKTGNSFIWTILGILVVSIIVGIYCYEQHKRKQKKETK